MPLTVIEAEEELKKAVEMEQEIAGELATVAGKLSDAEGTAGARSLEARKMGDQKTVQKINDEVLKLKNQHEVLSKTQAAAKLAVKQARHEIDQAHGRDLRAQAAKLTEQADERQKKTDNLLAELHKHEKIWFVPEPFVYETGVIVPNSYAVTETLKLRIDAEALIKQAVTIESQVRNFEPRPSVDGRVSGAVKV